MDDLLAEVHVVGTHLAGHGARRFVHAEVEDQRQLVARPVIVDAVLQMHQYRYIYNYIVLFAGYALILAKREKDGLAANTFSLPVLQARCPSPRSHEKRRLAQVGCTSSYR